MYVLHCVPTLHPKAGGPSRTVVQLADALAKHDELDVTIITQSRGDEPIVIGECGRVKRLVAYARSEFALRFAIPLHYSRFMELISSPKCIIHSHGLWHPANHWAASVARRKRIPLVIQPHGMLEPWALNQRAWKKNLALRLFQHADLDYAKILIGTSQEECENIRRLGLRQPIALIPNGVKLDIKQSKFKSKPSQKALRVRKVLFLSRIHQKKGLLNLVEAWAKIQPQDWHLQIAGPDEGGHLGEVQAAARRLRIENSIEYLRELGDSEKSKAYMNADLFVLPSFSENFGVVVAEALAHGLPVITTKGTPWSDLETFRCGWWVDIGAHPLVEALRTAMAMSDDERRAMGERARSYAQRYDWSDIAMQVMAVYRWALSGGLAPDCIIKD